MLKTIQMTIDESLLRRLDEAVAALEMTRSAFIRKAVEDELSRQRILELERQHAEGYAKHPVQPGEFDVWLGEQSWPDDWMTEEQMRGEK